MYARILKSPLISAKSFFLFGPRGTGKTSWIKQHIPNGLYLDLLDFALYHQLLANPNQLVTFISPNNQDQWIILDEVQRVPELLNEVHRLIEHQGYKFVLTGSSARSLKRKGINLLAGRALTYHMYPLTAQELESDFKLEHVLRYGSLPATFSEIDPAHFLRAYVDTYLREEVQQEGLTRQLGSFSRFLQVASFSQGSVVNKSAIAREVGANPKLVESYFTILEDLLLGFFLPVFTKRAKRRLVQHPKFYFFDVGVYRTLRPMGPFDRPEEVEGIALETWFLQELRALNDYLNLNYQLYFWQTSHGVEVDFVLYGEKGLHAFEIKRTHTFNTSLLKALRAFKDDYPIASCTLVYCGNQRRYVDNIEVVPFVEAIKELPMKLNS